MMCDIIIAGKSAKFGQPEINLALLPGAGGTQRLTRTIGKSKAMEMCLSGRMMGAEEALACGVVARVVEDGDVVESSTELGKQIASKSRIATLAVKEAVLTAYETTLQQGLSFERKSFHAAFSTEDAQEGLEAFVESRPPRWHNR
jgi:enoyl-CoA hydratase